MVYPVPIKGHPFGGSHSSVSIDGRIKLGPVMIPTINYEDYEGPTDIFDIMNKYGLIFEANPDFFKAL